MGIPDNQEIKNLKAELAEAREKLKQQEKFAILGQKTLHILHDIRSSMHRVDLSYTGAIYRLQLLKKNLEEAGIWIDEELYREIILDREREQEIIPKIVSHLERINRENNWIVEITDEIREFIEKSNYQNKLELINIPQMIAETINDSYNSIKEKEIAQIEGNRISYEVKLNCSVFVEIKTDRIKLKRILLNLFDNSFFAVFAKKHSEKSKSYTPQIKVDLTLEQDNVMIIIEDNGLGISAKNKELIFNPFVSTKPREYGTGLGLVIVKDLLAQIGGELELESSKGQYTKVTLSIPKIKYDV